MAREVNASYEAGDNRRSPINGISTIDLAYYSFASLEEFVTATDGTEIATKRGYSFQFRDTSGWCPLHTANYWYRCLLVKYQNPIGTDNDIQGTVILAVASHCMWVGEITGSTSFAVEWVAIKDHVLIREALPRSTSMLNGHFAAFTSGVTAMTSHADGDIASQYRVQLNNDGHLCKYTSTDSGANFSYNGRYLTHSDIGGYSVIKGTLHSNITQGAVAVIYNAYTKIAYLSMTVYVGTAISSSSNISVATSLPKAMMNMSYVAVQNGTGSYRGVVTTDGVMLAYTSSIGTGWWTASVAYPFSTL